MYWGASDTVIEYDMVLQEHGIYIPGPLKLPAPSVEELEVWGGPQEASISSNILQTS
jgi:hypothetical protein